MRRINQIEPWVDEKEAEELKKTIESTWITEAGRTKRFEEMVADFTGAKYASAFCNGTMTLFAALLSLGVKEGDEVLVPDLTMVASANAVILARAEPVFVDIERKTLGIDPEKMKEKINEKTVGIMPVPLNGRAPKMDEIIKVAREHNLFVLEDAAQALGCYHQGRHLGTIGDIGSFSFSTPKVITTGQGGMVVTNDEALYRKILMIRDFGRKERDSNEHFMVGWNFKFSDLLAAVGIVQMEKLPWRLKRKKEMFSLYKRELEEVEEVEFIKTDLENCSPWFIDVLVPDPVKLKEYLNTRDVGTRLFYHPLHSFDFYKQGGDYPIATDITSSGLWLPSSTFLSDENIIRVCGEIKAYFGKEG